jgi:hypothetical protein
MIQMSQSRNTYRAVQAVGPGQLELTEKPLIDPQRVYVRIRVEVRGVRYTDAATTIEGALPIQWPRVPGQGLHCAQVSTRDRPLLAPIGGQLLLSSSSTWKSPRWAINLDPRYYRTGEGR